MNTRTPSTPLIVGNWKMNFTEAESVRLAADLVERLPAAGRPEIVVAPAFPNLPAVARTLGGGPIALAAQDLHWEDSGAYTGEVSAAMLRSVGCRYVLVGHSERRQYFGETDHTVNLKVRAALDGGLRPILCIGESEQEREAGRTAGVIRTQLLRALEGFGPEPAGGMEIAYEPVWAIGTGRTATVEQANEVHRGIRDEFARRFPSPAGRSIRVLYGGSVTPDNIDALMASPVIDGVLVGGASLNADRFARIIAFRGPGAAAT